MDLTKIEFFDLYQDQTLIDSFCVNQLKFNLIDAFDILRLMKEKDTGSFMISQKRIRQTEDSMAHIKYCRA